MSPGFSDSASLGRWFDPSRAHRARQRSRRRSRYRARTADRTLSPVWRTIRRPVEYALCSQRSTVSAQGFCTRRGRGPSFKLYARRPVVESALFGDVDAPQVGESRGGTTEGGWRPAPREDVDVFELDRRTLLEVHDRARFEPHLAASSSNTPAQIDVAELSELVIKAADRPKGRDIADEAVCLSVVNGCSRQPAALAVGHASEAEFLVEVIDTLPLRFMYSRFPAACTRSGASRINGTTTAAALSAKPFAAPIKPSGMRDEIRVEQGHRRRVHLLRSRCSVSGRRVRISSVKTNLTVGKSAFHVSRQRGSAPPTTAMTGSASRPWSRKTRRQVGRTEMRSRITTPIEHSPDNSIDAI